MQDRFKFRTWYTDKYGETEMIYDTQATYDNGNNRPPGSYDHCNFQEVLEDKNCITMQCTGMKDKNGTLIYEGDIVSFKIGSIPTKAVVSWSDECAVWIKGPQAYLGSYQRTTQVIGNIYENKELLERNE